MPKKPQTVRPFLALTRIMSEGEVYERGGSLDLTDHQARQLLEAGAVKPFLVPASGTDPAQNPPTPTQDASDLAPQVGDPA